MSQKKRSGDQISLSQEEPKKKKNSLSLTIHFDNTISKSVGGSELEAEVKSLGAIVKLENNKHPNSICFESEDGKMFPHVIIRITSDIFLEKMANFETKFLNPFHFANCKIFLILEGMDKIYLNWQRNLYAATQKGTATTNLITPDKVEQLLMRFNIKSGINVVKTADLKHTIDHIKNFITKLDDPRREKTVYDFHSSELKTPKTLKDMYKCHLSEVVPERVADAIMRKFPTLKSLLKEYYENDKTEDQKKLLLMDIECVYESGQGRVQTKTRRIGKSVSEKVYGFYKQ